MSARVRALARHALAWKLLITFMKHSWEVHASQLAVWACREVHPVKGWFPGETPFPKEWKFASFPYGCEGLLGQKPARSLEGKARPIPWAPRYLDLIPCDFYLWWYVKHQVFQPLKPQSFERKFHRPQPTSIHHSCSVHEKNLSIALMFVE